MLIIHVFYDKDDGLLKSIERIFKILKEEGFNVRIYVQSRHANGFEKAVKVYGITQLPTVIYSLESKERVRFEGSYVPVCYLWKAVSILRPFTGKIPRKRRTRGYDELMELTKRRK